MNTIVIPITNVNPKDKLTPIWVARYSVTTLSALGKNLLAPIAQVKAGSVSVHKFSVLQGIKNMMAHCKNGPKTSVPMGVMRDFHALWQQG